MNIQCVNAQGNLSYLCKGSLVYLSSLRQLRNEDITVCYSQHIVIEMYSYELP